MNILFVEDFDKMVLKYLDYQIVALTPKAMYDLDKLNIQYKIPEDYLKWTEKSSYREMFESFLITLQYKIGIFYGTRQVIVDYYFSMLDKFISSVIIAHDQMTEILDVEKPNDIIFIGKEKGDIIDDELHFVGNSLYRRTVKYLKCEMTKFIDVEKGENIKKVANWKDNKELRFVYDSFKSFCWFPTWKFNKKKIFFANFNSKHIRTARLLGYSTNILLDFDIEFSEHSFFIDREFFNDFDIDREYLCYILEDGMCRFVNDIIPKTIGYIEKYKRFIGENRKKIDCVVFNRLNSARLVSLLIACNSQCISTIYIRHGWDAYDSYHSYYTRLKFFDHFICEKEDADFFRKVIEKENFKCDVI